MLQSLNILLNINLFYLSSRTTSIENILHALTKLPSSIKRSSSSNFNNRRSKLKSVEFVEPTIKTPKGRRDPNSPHYAGRSFWRSFNRSASMDFQTNRKSISHNHQYMDEVSENNTRRSSPVSLTQNGQPNLTILSTPIEYQENNNTSSRRRSSLRKLLEMLGIDKDTHSINTNKRDNFPIDTHLNDIFNTGKILPSQPLTIDMSVSRQLGRGTYGLCYEVAVWCIAPDCFSGHSFECYCKCHSKPTLKKRRYTIYKALKILMKDIVDEKRTLFEREVEVHWKLMHENVLRLFGGFVETSSGSICLLLELCPLGSLSDYVNEQRKKYEQENHYNNHDSDEFVPICDTKASKVFYGLVCALHYIHSVHFIVHRDVKPANVMLKQDFSPKLSDFGLSCTLEQCQINKTAICGTPNYLAPEVFLKFGHTFESDYWSLGCTLFFLLCGRSPFQQKRSNSSPFINEPEVQALGNMEETWQQMNIPIIGTDVSSSQRFNFNPPSRDIILRDIYRQVITGKYHFPKNVSQPARRVIRGLLQREQTKRYTANELFSLSFAKIVKNSDEGWKNPCCQCVDYESVDIKEIVSNIGKNDGTIPWRESLNLDSYHGNNKPTIANAEEESNVYCDSSSIASLVLTGTNFIEDTVSILADRWNSKRKHLNSNAIFEILWISRWALTAKIILYYTLDSLRNPYFDRKFDDQATPTLTRRTISHHIDGEKKETYGAIDTDARSIVFTNNGESIEFEPANEGNSLQCERLVDLDTMKIHCDFLCKKLRCFTPNESDLKDFFRQTNSFVTEEDWPDTTEAYKSIKPVFVQKWILANDEIVFLFSDGSYQINYKNHFKIIIFGKQGVLNWYSKGKNNDGIRKSSKIQTEFLPDVCKWLKGQNEELISSTWRLLKPLI